MEYLVLWQNVCIAVDMCWREDGHVQRILLDFYVESLMSVNEEGCMLLI